MEKNSITSIDHVLLTRRGHHITGSLLLSKHHMVFTFRPDPTTAQQKEIWICFPIIDKILKARGNSWDTSQSSSSFLATSPASSSPNPEGFDKYMASHIKIFCKDFTFYSFDFQTETACAEVFKLLSRLTMASKLKGLRKDLYASEYRPNMMEAKLQDKGWNLYDPEAEYTRQGLTLSKLHESVWRLSSINAEYKLCSSYPKHLIVPNAISDSVLQHASKFRLKQRIPAVVYRHRIGSNQNVIARCAQPLVGLNFQNRSLQDEKLVEEIFRSQEREVKSSTDSPLEYGEQPQRNLIVDLRPITNAMAQHALGAGTENVENYKGKVKEGDGADRKVGSPQRVDKIFCNIDNIHVMRDSLNKLTSVLSELDRYPVASNGNFTTSLPLLQQALTKTQWLHRLSIILQSVDRITKSIHLNNTNVLIHCSDGWDRTSQVSALLQICLDPYFRTMKGFMVLIEKEWLSFGFKFATRADHGACVGALLPAKEDTKGDSMNDSDSVTLPASSNFTSGVNKASVATFLLKAALHLKNTASAAKLSVSERGTDDSRDDTSATYTGSSEKSPIFHQFLDCVYQILRQHPDKFEFNSRFLKRLFYHHYSCQYGTFLCDSDYEASTLLKTKTWSISVWDYFLSRPNEFRNPKFDQSQDAEVLFSNFSDVKWWFELYGRSDEEMNGLSNSLDRKFAQLRLGESLPQSDSESSTGS